MKKAIVFALVLWASVATSAQSAPAPASALAVAAETVTPADVVAVGFCGDSSWNASKWFLVLIDGAAQAFPGALIPALEVGCYQTPKAYSFPAGEHTIGVELVNHEAGGDYYSAPVSIAVVSAVPVDTRPAAPLAVVTVADCRIVVSATPPDASKGWIAQFKAGASSIGTADSSAPYTRTLSTLKPGAYDVTVEWSKAGTAAVVSAPAAVSCK